MTCVCGPSMTWLVPSAQGPEEMVLKVGIWAVMGGWVAWRDSWGSHFIGWDGGGRWVGVGVVAMGVMIVGGVVVVDVMMDVEQWE